jgi:hypothetical protein
VSQVQQSPLRRPCVDPHGRNLVSPPPAAALGPAAGRTNRMACAQRGRLFGTVRPSPVGVFNA